MILLFIYFADTYSLITSSKNLRMPTNILIYKTYIEVANQPIFGLEMNTFKHTHTHQGILEIKKILKKIHMQASYPFLSK